MKGTQYVSQQKELPHTLPSCLYQSHLASNYATSDSQKLLTTINQAHKQQSRQHSLKNSTHERDKSKNEKNNIRKVRKDEKSQNRVFEGSSPSSMSENIDDEDDIDRQNGPKKPNQEFSNSKVITAAASTYIAQELAFNKNYSSVSYQGDEFSPEQIEKMQYLKMSSTNLMDNLNDTTTGIVIRDFDLNSLDKSNSKLFHKQVSQTTNKLKEKNQSRILHQQRSTGNNEIMIQKTVQNLNEERPLQMNNQQNNQARQNMNKKLSSNNIKLATQTFDSSILAGDKSAGGLYSNYHINSTKNIIRQGGELMSSTKHVLTTTNQKRNQKMKRVRSQTSAKEQFNELESSQRQHNLSGLILNLANADQSGVIMNNLTNAVSSPNFQFEFGVHRPTNHALINYPGGQKLSIGANSNSGSLNPYYSPHNQSTTCFMTGTANRTMRNDNLFSSQQYQQPHRNQNTGVALVSNGGMGYALQTQQTGPLISNSHSSMNFMLSNSTNNFHQLLPQQQQSQHQQSQLQIYPQLTHQQTQYQEHESIDNLYTLKKVQSKVRDKLVPWIDLQSTAATNNGNYGNQGSGGGHSGSLPRQTEESMAGFSHLNKVSLGAINSIDNRSANLNHQKSQDSANLQVQTESGFGILKYAKLSNLAFKRKNTEATTANPPYQSINANAYGSPPDKMSFYNFTQVQKPANLSHANKALAGDLNKSTHSRSNNDYFHEESMCITEENRFQNEINPIKLADLEWGDQYKLDKLMRQQIRQIQEGKFDPNTYFAYDDFIIEQAFQWFDIARKDQEVIYLMKRKSSAGLVQQNTLVNQSLAEFGGFAPGNTNFKLQTSGTMLNFGNVNQSNQRGLSILMGPGGGMGGSGDLPDQVNLMGTESSSDDEGGDEAKKFKNTFLKSKSGTKFLLMNAKRNNNNLLIKAQEQYQEDTEQSLDKQQNEDDQDDFNNLTPKLLSSNEQSDEDEKEDRPLQIRTNFKVLEELIEESREESMRGDSNQQILLPLKLDSQCRQSLSKVQFQINLQEDELQEEELPQHQQIQQTDQNMPATSNRMYDSDIFVMSNTTFDEDIASISSRRASIGGKQQLYRNEFLSFVDNSQDLSGLKGLNQSQIEGITNKLFFQQQKQQLQQRKQQKRYEQIKDSIGNRESTIGLSPKNNIAMKNKHVKQKTSQQRVAKNKEKPLTSSIQTLLSQNNNNQTLISTNLQSTTHEKKQSLTKFSNYVSSSNNLSPVPPNLQQSTTFFNFKHHQSQHFRNNKTQYNSMSSINFGNGAAASTAYMHKQQPSTILSNVFQVNSGHFSILSGGSNTYQNMQAINQMHQQLAEQNQGFNMPSLYQVGKSHSNENFSKQAIAINCQTGNGSQGLSTIHKITHHSPQCSLTMRSNLSPGPGYKVRERNSLFQKDRMTRNKNSLGITPHLSDTDISQSKFVVITSKHHNNHKSSSAISQSLYSQVKRGTIQSVTNKNSSQRVFNLTNSHIHDHFGNTNNKQSLINNSTAVDSLNPSSQKQNVTLGQNAVTSIDLKQTINASKLRKQRSDSKLDSQSLHLFEGGGSSMVTQKLLASIKQNMINKKLQQESHEKQRVQESQNINFNQLAATDDTNNNSQLNQPLQQQLNRQRSKSEIETIYEIGNKHQQLMTSKNHRLNNQRANNQTLFVPMSPDKSIKSVTGFPYNNGKTMSDINKFFDERSEHNLSVQSVLNRNNQNMSVTSKINQELSLQFTQSQLNQQTIGGNAYISVGENTGKTFDMISNGSGSNIFSQKLSQSISGQGVLKQPSIIHQSSKLEIMTHNETSNSPQVKDFKNTQSQQSFKLNFGIQPHLVKKYQSPTAALSQSYQLSSGFNQMSLSKRNHFNDSQLLLQTTHNNSLIHPSSLNGTQTSTATHLNKTKSIPNHYNPPATTHNSISYNSHLKVDQAPQKLNGSNSKQNTGKQIASAAVMKQRIARSPNKKSMMILNSSLGSNSNNVSLIQAVAGYYNQNKGSAIEGGSGCAGTGLGSNISSGVNSNYNSHLNYDKRHHESSTSEIVRVIEYSDQKQK